MKDNERKLLNAAGQGEAARLWLESAGERMDASDGLADELSLLWAMARRKLGDEPIGERLTQLATAHGPLPVAQWGAGDAGRVALLLRAAASDEDLPAIVNTLFRHGDETERAAVVAALSLLPESARYKPLALEAGRVNSLALFSALAQNNPYPAAVYEDHEFNQLVLKSLFVGLEIRLILGLGDRANAELSRMCHDYHDERVAARRDVPRDIWLAMAPHADAGAVELLTRYLGDDDRTHRYYVAMALSERKTLPDDAASAVKARLELESDEDTLVLLRRAGANR